MDQFSRTELVLGAAAVAHLKTCRVAIFGVGGVGGYAAEALVRSGIGAIDLYDDDRVCLTNLNRQLIATRKTVGQYKVDAMEQATNSIHPVSAWPISKRRASAPSRASCAPSFASVKFASSRSSFPMNSPSSPTTTPH